MIYDGKYYYEDEEEFQYSNDDEWCDIMCGRAEDFTPFQIKLIIKALSEYINNHGLDNEDEVDNIVCMINYFNNY